MTGNWNNLSFTMQGDVSYSLSISSVSLLSVDFRLIGYSEKWNNFDVAFEYQDKESLAWIDDASIISTNAKYLKGNKLYGLDASKYGSTNIFRWKYIDNHFLMGNTINVRIRILPRIKNFGHFYPYSSVSESYGENKADIDSWSNDKKCLMINNVGQYVCSNGADITVYNSLSDIMYVYRTGIFMDIRYITQILSGDYIACDYSNNTIYEISEDLSTIKKAYSVINPVFVDYSEETENILVSTKLWDGTRHKIYEISWSNNDYGTILWECEENTINPESVTYSYGNSEEIVISDYGNNRIIIIDRNNDTKKYIGQYKLGVDDTSAGKISNFNKPFRAYKLMDGNICIVEKEGRVIDFEVIASSSSSSSSSSTSSSSSSSVYTEGSSSSLSSHSSLSSYSSLSSLSSPSSLSSSISSFSSSMDNIRYVNPSGALSSTPEVYGEYTYDGMYLGEPSYTNGTYCIWSGSLYTTWWITQTKGNLSPPLWSSTFTGSSNYGNYSPLIGTTGNLIVSDNDASSSSSSIDSSSSSSDTSLSSSSSEGYSSNSSSSI